MNKAAQVNAIYNELRSVMGDETSPKELLQHAHSLVELFSDELYGPHCEFYLGGTPFETWAMDTAISDGGWRIFWYEFHSGAEMDRDTWDDVPPDLLEGQIDMEALTCQM